MALCIAIFFFLICSARCAGTSLSKVEGWFFFINLTFFCPLFFDLIGFLWYASRRDDCGLVLHFLTELNEENKFWFWSITGQSMG
jgi:hypothetical protein